MRRIRFITCYFLHKVCIGLNIIVIVDFLTKKHTQKRNILVFLVWIIVIPYLINNLTGINTKVLPLAISKAQTSLLVNGTDNGSFSQDPSSPTTSFHSSAQNSNKSRSIKRRQVILRLQFASFLRFSLANLISEVYSGCSSFKALIFFFA